MANNAADEEIIEKRPSHPVSTACLILAAVAILAALVLQVYEISQVRARMTPAEKASPQPYKSLYKKNLKEFKDSVEKLIAENEHLDIVPSEPAGGGPGSAGSSGDTGASPPVKAAGSRASPVSSTPAPVSSPPDPPEGAVSSPPDPSEEAVPSPPGGPPEGASEEGTAEPPSGEVEKAGTTEKGEERAAGEPPPKEPAPAEAERAPGE